MPYARVNKIDLYFESHGSGDPILLIPGLGSDAATWSSFVPEVEDFRTIILENRGSGRSSKPEGPYSTEMMAEDAIALLDHLGISQVHVIGKSMGAMIAQWIAARWPEKVRSLVLASTVKHHDEYGSEMLEIGRTVAQRAGLFPAYKLTFMLSYSREYYRNNKARLQQVEAFLSQVDSAEILRAYREQSIACQKHDGRGILSRIQAPTLVIAGQNDIITPPEASAEIAASIPRSELKIFPKGGHGFWREFPREVNAIVRDFLTSH